MRTGRIVVTKFLQGGEGSVATAFVPETPQEQKALDDLEELFHAFDEDGSGELSPQEVKELLQTMGTNLGDDELSKLIKMMDADASVSTCVLCEASVGICVLIGAMECNLDT